MSTETIENALAQALVDIQEIKKASAEQRQLVQQLLDKIGSLENHLEHQKRNLATVDWQPPETAIKQYMEQLRVMIREQNKSTKRILLFPEYNAKEYYSVVLKWVLYIIIASYCCYITKYLIDHLF